MSKYNDLDMKKWKEYDFTYFKSDYRTGTDK